MTNQKIAAVFDVDGTLIAHDSLERIFFRFLWRYDEIGWLALTGLGRSALSALYKGLAAMSDNKLWLRGQEAKRLKHLARDCFEQEVRHRLLPGALARLCWHQQAGHEIILLSGTPDVLLEPLAEYLRVTSYIGAPMEISAQKVTGRLSGPRPFGINKVACLTQTLKDQPSAAPDLRRSFAYGDHYADRFLLTTVGNPVAANPDRRLRRVAERRGWMIEQFG